MRVGLVCAACPARICQPESKTRLKNLIYDNVTRNIMKIKLLLDANVLVSGLSSRLGASFALLEAVAVQRVDLVASAT
jgi:putative PIN family toxin of toxin-antitoxin system